jgi:predicted aspartyl protease
VTAVKALVTLLAAAMTALAAADAPAAAPAPPAADSHGYPLTLVNGTRILLAARVNGHAVTALLDSAAEATVVDRQYARRIGLGTGQAVTGQGSGQASFAANLVDGVTLEAVGLTLPDQTVALADLGDVGRRLLGRRIDVILGREIFDAARLSIDLGRHRIAVLAADATPAGTRLDLVTEHGVETIPVRVEDRDVVRATFDLGNGAKVLVGRAYADRVGLLTDGRPVGVERGGGLGGETARQTLTLTAVEIAGRRFSGVPAAIDPQPSASALNVGVRLLRHFLITTDFAGHAVWLQALPARGAEATAWK